MSKKTKKQPNKQSEEHLPETELTEGDLVKAMVADGHNPFALEEERVLFILGEINAMTLAAIAPVLHIMDQTDGDITVKISSPGGEVACGFAIYDMLRSCKNQVRTEGYGQVESIAALVFQGGDKRYLSPNTTFMIHANHAAFTMPGDSKFYQSQADEMERLNQIFCTELAKKSKLTTAEIRELCDSDTFFDPKAAIKYGFADGIIKPTKK